MGRDIRLALILLLLIFSSLAYPPAQAQESDFIAMSANPVIHVCMGSTYEDIITITNTGIFSETYTVAPAESDAQSWQTVVPVVFTLDPMQTQELRNFISPPARKPGLYDAGLLISAGGVQKILGQQVNVRACNNIAVGVSQASFSNCPCSPTIYEFEIRNIGSFPETYDISLNIPSDQYALSENPAIIPSGESRTIFVYVTMPCEIYGDQKLSFNIDARGSGFSSSTPFYLNLRQSCYDYEFWVGEEIELFANETFDITYNPKALPEYSLCENQLYAIPFKVANNASFANSFDFSIRGPKWAALETKRLDLASGQEGIGLISVRPQGVESELIIHMAESVRGDLGKELKIDLFTRDCQIPAPEPKKVSRFIVISLLLVALLLILIIAFILLYLLITKGDRKKEEAPEDEEARIALEEAKQREEERQRAEQEERIAQEEARQAEELERRKREEKKKAREQKLAAKMAPIPAYDDMDQEEARLEEEDGKQGFFARYFWLLLLLLLLLLIGVFLLLYFFVPAVNTWANDAYDSAASVFTRPPGNETIEIPVNETPINETPVNESVEYDCGLDGCRGGDWCSVCHAPGTLCSSHGCISPTEYQNLLSGGQDVALLDYYEAPAEVPQEKESFYARAVVPAVAAVGMFFILYWLWIIIGLILLILIVLLLWWLLSRDEEEEKRRAQQKEQERQEMLALEKAREAEERKERIRQEREERKEKARKQKEKRQKELMEKKRKEKEGPGFFADAMDRFRGFWWVVALGLLFLIAALLFFTGIYREFGITVIPTLPGNLTNESALPDDEVVLFIPTEENSTTYIWFRNSQKEIDLSRFLADGNVDEISLSATEVANMTITVEGSLARIVPDEGFSGIRFVNFIAEGRGGLRAVSPDITLVVLDQDANLFKRLWENVKQYPMLYLNYGLLFLVLVCIVVIFFVLMLREEPRKGIVVKKK